MNENNPAGKTNDNKIIFSTGNFDIRLPEYGDTAAVYAYRSLPEVARYHCYEPMSLQEVKEWVNMYANKSFGVEGEWVQYVIAKKTDAAIVGDIAAFLPAASQQTAEIGITVSPLHQRQGVGKEALQGFIDWLIVTNGIQRIEAVIELENKPSIALMTTLGFEKQTPAVIHTWKNKPAEQFAMFVLNVN